MDTQTRNCDPLNLALLKKVEQHGAYATFLCQERALMHITQMRHTHTPTSCETIQFSVSKSTACVRHWQVEVTET